MKVSCDEGLASHVGPESCVAVRKGVDEALTDFGELSRTGESAGRVLSLENVILWSADAVLSGGRQQRSVRHRKDRTRSTWSQTPRTHRSISQGRQSLPRGGHALHIGSREIPGSTGAVAQVRAVNSQEERRR